jgi:hydroxylamine reductase
MENQMFCYQCQETAGCSGCTKAGVCGKQPQTARLQDLLVYATKGLSEVTTKLRTEGKEVGADVDHLITLNLFTTITNANFNDAVFYDRIKMTLNVKKDLTAKLSNKTDLSATASWYAATEAELDAKAASKEVGVLATENEDVRSLRELITYGLKGLSAYMKHANALGYDDAEINAFMQSSLAKLLDDSLTADDLVALTLETGKFGVNGMALLDKANTSTYGNPEISKVNIGVGKNPGIIISGHDLRDLEQLLEQTQGTGVDVYTHSEMLPAHYYPHLKKYSNLVGNYGNAWGRRIRGPVLQVRVHAAADRRRRRQVSRVHHRSALASGDPRGAEGRMSARRHPRALGAAPDRPARQRGEDERRDRGRRLRVDA